METLSEIRQQEIEKQDRARRYESLLNSRVTLQATVNRLESLKDFEAALPALTEIHALCERVPQGILTRGMSSQLGFGLPGGMVARDVLLAVASDALGVAARKESERVADLAKAQNALAEVERQLRDDFNE